IIPIVMAFDQNYYLPAGVAMHSMLTYAARVRGGTPLFYKIHCLVQGLDTAHKATLQNVLMAFKDFSSLEFHDLDLLIAPTTEPQNHRTTEPQNHRTTEPQNHRTTENPI
ncbi:glycosyltransferase family 8 protein, partial [Helicobacter vulpis]|uniref:glycosyltransferase family 8 protein n=1 Tax=Helicobacter vulpis TaxID=2316076 RepID=UPI0013CE078E